MSRGSTGRALAVAGVACLWLLFAGAADIEAQTIRVRPGAYASAPGGEVTLPIELETTDLVTGFSFGVSHDGAAVRLDSVAPTEDLLTAMGLDAGADPTGDFFLVDLDPAGDTTGFIVAAILSQDDAGIGLGAGTHHLFDATYVVEAGASGSTTIEVSGSVGVPAVELTIDVDSGTGRTFEGSSVEVTLGTSFQRGDANADGRLNISDATHILFYLYRGGDLGTCPIALNANGSVDQGEPGVEDLDDIRIDDAIRILQYLFSAGIAPAAPFPDCGQSPSPVAAEMVCVETGGCP